MAISTAWKIDGTSDPLTTSYVRWAFPDLCREFVVINDEDPTVSTDKVYVSFNGVDDMFILEPGEFRPWIAERNGFKEFVWLKYSGAGAPDYRGMSAPR